MTKIKIAVIGLGYMGINHLRVYKKIPEVELIGYYDLKKFNLKNELNVYRFKSLEDVARKVDAVSIATPASTHHKICSFFLKKKIHCLLEKPMGTSEKECKELIKLAKKFDLTLLIGQIERFNPVVTKLKSIIKNFELRVINIERLSFIVNRNQDIDTVLDLMIHDIDLLNYLIDSKITKINSMGYLTKKSPEYVSALLKFNNNTLGQLTSSRITKSNVRKMNITCKNAYIRIDFINQSMEIVHKVNPIKRKDIFGNYDVDFYTEQLFIKKEEPLYHEISHFLKAIQKKEDLIIKPLEALESLKVAWKIREILKVHE